MRVRANWIVGIVAIMFATAGPIASRAPQVIEAAAAPHVQDSRRNDGPLVTLAELLREAAERNPDLIALRRQVEALRQRPPQERGLNPPMLEAQIWQWPINTLNPANANMYMFMMGQDLPGRGKRDLRAAIAEKDVALAEADVTVRARQIVGEIKQAYAALFIARKATEIDRANIDLLRQIADVSQAKYTAGRISQQDVLKSVVELSTRHDDIIVFDEQASLAAARLNVLLDRPPDTPLGALVEPDEQRLLPSTTELQRIAIERQPELQKARLDIERAEAQLASAKSEYKPDFSLQGGYMLMPNMTDAWTGRIAITWPNAPWSHAKIDASVAEQTAAVDTAKARARAMEDRLRLAVQEAYVRAKAAQDRAALLRTTILPQSRQTLEVSRVAYEADRVDIQTLLENERILLDSQLNYFRALSDFDQAVADLERAIGTDLPPGTLAAATTSGGQ